MEKGFSLIEFLLVLIIFIALVAIIGGISHSVFRDSLLLFQISSDLSSSLNEVEHFFMNVHRYVRSLGRRTDEITISEKAISGKVKVLGDEYDASLKIEDNDGKESLTWEVNGTKKVIIPPSRNVNMIFEEPSQDFINKFGYGVIVRIEKWMPLGNATKTITREIFIPFINVT